MPDLAALHALRDSLYRIVRGDSHRVRMDVLDTVSLPIVDAMIQELVNTAIDASFTSISTAISDVPPDSGANPEEGAAAPEQPPAPDVPEPPAE